MSYIVFARKYRPRSFDQIIGQSHITTTLKNAIDQSRVAHAYLFAGPRGVGKTTTARILAKALNCDKGPTPDPCNECASCREITAGSSLDILEIDGASNRGVDEIKSLRENAKFTPSRGRFRVYIIDEVHMLSNEAFNALLKMLEEPPPHVKFIFATTHANKVPLTILSRCQKFDFRRIPTAEILNNLKTITAEERFQATDEALGLIAKHGDGSMRDAQVILDQIASFTNRKIVIDDVIKILGIVDDEIFFGLSSAIYGKDPKTALKIIDKLINDGKDAKQVLQGLIEHFRNMAVAKVDKEPGALIDAGKDKIEHYRVESAKFTMEEILYVIYTLSNAIEFMRKTDIARIPFEMALVKLTRSQGALPIGDIIKRVEELEHKAASPQAAMRPGASLKSRMEEEPFSDDAQRNIAAISGSSSFTQRSGSLDEILSSWTKVINYIRARKISIASYLQEGDPINLEGGTLTIGFAKEFQFHKEVLESPDNKKLIETAIKDMLGKELTVLLEVTESAASGIHSANNDLAGVDGLAEEDKAGGETMPEDEDPIVKKALELFNGKLVRSRNAEESMK